MDHEAQTPERPGPTRKSRDAILRAAKRLFAQDGPERVTMRRISGDSGLTLPVLYHYFGDKRALYLACLEDAAHEAAGVLRAALATAGSPRGRLDAFIAALGRLLIARPSLLAYVLGEGATRTDGFDAAPLAAVLDEADAVLAAAGLRGPSPARCVVAQAIGMALLERLGCVDEQAALRALADCVAQAVGPDAAAA